MGQWIQTDIPEEAWTVGQDTVLSNIVLDGVVTGGGMNYGGGTMYLQKGLREFGCSSGRGTWYGLVRATQGRGDQIPNGIGGHCDSCSFGTTKNGNLNTDCGADWEHDCFTSHKNIEQYISNWKDVGGGNGAGGTSCAALGNKYSLNFRMWAW